MALVLSKYTDPSSEYTPASYAPLHDYCPHPDLLVKTFPLDLYFVETQAYSVDARRNIIVKSKNPKSPLGPLRNGYNLRDLCMHRIRTKLLHKLSEDSARSRSAAQRRKENSQYAHLTVNDWQSELHRRESVE